MIGNQIALLTDSFLGGCCPDGYECERAGNCVPPSGSPYTFGCPKSHYLCPSSASYGCCPDHMGCGVNQCYSTEPQTITTTDTITTKRNGKKTTFQTTGTTVSTPAMPSKTQNINANMDDDEQVVFKYFPSAQAKVSPTASSKDDNGGSSGLTKGQLGGIVAGAVIFLAIILLCAFFIIRRLNTVAAAVSNSGNSKQSDGSKLRPPMKQFRPTDSEIDALSVDPLMMSPRPSHARPNPSPDPLFGHGSPDLSSNPTPSSFAGGYQPVSTPGNSRHTSVDAAGNVISYFEYPANQTTRHSHGSGPTPPGHRGSADTQQTTAYQHLRSWSNASETSEEGFKTAGPSALELDGSPYVPELVGSPTIGTTGVDERRASSGSVGSTGTTRPPLAHQRRRSDGKQGIRSDSGSTPNILGVLSEEIHGFHGPTDHMAGQTERSLPRKRVPGNEASGNSQSDAAQK